MNDYSPITTACLVNLFEGLRTQSHAVFAFLSALDKEDFYIFHVYDFRLREEPAEQGRAWQYTVPEFLEKASSFDPRDEFCVYFIGFGDRDDVMSPPMVEINTAEGASVGEFTALTSEFLEPYCEKCLRADAPFLLTPETVARLGFTEADTEAWRSEVDRCNALAAARLQAEYDALKGLRCIVRCFRGCCIA